MLETQTSPEFPRILVVDDNDDNLYTLTLYLELEGYTNITAAREGEEAIQRLADAPFDLVLLDVMMPRVDGFEVLRWIKTQSRLQDVPVIMVSALDEVASIVRCIELGAVDYLLKPFNPILLKARLSATLEKKRLRDSLDGHLRRLQAEIDTARKLQMGMVPQAFPEPSPDLPLDVFASMEPAQEVGGDLYDFFSVEDGRFCLLVGDVSGKGMPAALFMARTKALIRITAELMCARNGGKQPRVIDPADVLARVNLALCEDNADMMFVTVFFAMIDPLTGATAFCNAGHNAPYCLSRTEVAAIEYARNVPLGIRAGAMFRAGEFTLAPSDTLYLFTDGVTEAANSDQDQFSEARLETVLRAMTGASSAAVIMAVTAAVQDFVGSAQPSDDVTMLAVRLLAELP